MHLFLNLHYRLMLQILAELSHATGRLLLVTIRGKTPSSIAFSCRCPRLPFGFVLVAPVLVQPLCPCSPVGVLLAYSPTSLRSSQPLSYTHALICSCQACYSAGGSGGGFRLPRVPRSRGDACNYIIRFLQWIARTIFKFYKIILGCKGLHYTRRILA